MNGLLKRVSPFPARKLIAALLGALLLLSGLVSVLLITRTTVAAGAAPGTGQYYADRRDEAFMRAGGRTGGWIAPGTPCTGSNGSPAVTVATATVAAKTWSDPTYSGTSGTIPGIAATDPLHGGGPWKLDLDYTGPNACSLPWNGNTPTSAANAGLTVGAGTVANPYQVTTAAQYRYCVYYRQSCILMNDIDLGGYLGSNWTTPTTAASAAWTINGNSKTVYNYYMYVTTAANQSMFGAANSLTVWDLRMSNAYAFSTTDALALWFASNSATLNSTIENCATENSVVFHNGAATGNPRGAVVYSSLCSNMTIRNCYTDNCHVISFGYSLSSCTAQIAWAGNNNEVTNTFAINGTSIGNIGHNGGFVSCLQNNSTIRNCFSDLDVYGNIDAGTFFGFAHAASTNHIVENCFTSGKVEGTRKLGGFIGGGDASNRIQLTRCYSTSMTGVSDGSTQSGGFIGSFLAGSGVYTFTDCYAAGEVGSLDTVLPGGATSATNTVGGFVGDNNASAGTKTFNNCFYDKQTTAMREWASGQSHSVGGITGVLTTTTAKAGLGLTDDQFRGFGNNTQWVFEEGHYPQLDVFANPTTFTNTNWMPPQQLDSLVMAYSRASASTVFLETWEAGLDPGNPPSATTYDTVRDVVLGFPMTYTPDTAWRRVGNGTTLANGAGNNTMINGDPVPVLRLTPESGVYGAHYKAQNLQPGVEWLRVNTREGDQTGTRALRVVPTSGIAAGPNARAVRDMDLYDHRDGVRLSYTTGPAMALGQPISEAAFKPSTTDFTNISVPSGLDNPGVPGTLHVRISLITGYDGNAEPILSPTPLDPDNNANEKDWLTGEIPVGLTGSFMAQYFWELADGRYMRDQKRLNILFSPEMEKNAYLNGSAIAENGEITPVPVSVGDEIEYALTLRVPEDLLAPQYDIVFVLDWSGSMNSLMDSGKNGLPQSARSFSKDIIMEMSADIFDRYPGSRVAVMGLNCYQSEKPPYVEGNNKDNPANLFLQYDTNFVGSGEYTAVIQAAFQENPAFVNDDNAQFLAAAVDKLAGDTSTAYGTAWGDIDPDKTHVVPRLDQSRTPVIVLISDFQIMEEETYLGLPYPMDHYWTQRFSRESQRYYDTFGGDCVLLTVRMDHDGQTDYSGNPLYNKPENSDYMINCVSPAGHGSWDFTSIPTGMPYLTALKKITRMLDNKIAVSGSVTDYLPEGLGFLGQTDSTGKAVFTQAGQKCEWSWANLPPGEITLRFRAEVTDPYALYANRAWANIGKLPTFYSNTTRHAYALEDQVKNARVSTDGGATFPVSASNGTATGPVLVKPGDWIEYEFLLHSAALPPPLRVKDERVFQEPTSAGNAPVPVNFVNGSFEQPALPSTVGYTIYPSASVPGWSTRPTYASGYSNPQWDTIEIQKVNGVAGFAEVPAVGNQYGELNANVEGVLYQVCNTTPNTKLYWEFYHSARVNGSTDVMEFFLAPATTPTYVDPISPLVPKPYMIKRCSDGHANASRPWGYHYGSYLVPSGQTQTEFAFASISSPTGIASGNFLDGIRLYTQSYLLLTKSSSAAGGKTDVGKTVTYSINVQNLGECDASGIVVSDELPPGMDFFAGSIEIDGLPAGAAGTYDPAARTVRVELNYVKGLGSFSNDCKNAYEITFKVTINDAEIAEDLHYTNQAKATYRDRDHETEMEDEEHYSNVYAIELERHQAATLTDTLPDGLLYQSHTTNGCTFSRSGQTCTWEWTDIPAGETRVTVRVEVDQAKVLYDNHGTVTIEGLGSEDTNHTYHKALYLLYVRQVVLGYNSRVDQPPAGHLQLTNNGGATHILCASGKDGTSVEYTVYSLPANADPVYWEKLFVPQYHSYEGYLASGAGGLPHNKSALIPPGTTANGAVRLDFAGIDELWLTLYVKPFNAPGKNSVDYVTNLIGKIMAALP